ncbi:MAG: sensor histidine kinase [Erysipelotrichaceae bacterium]|nr:sensor histidine kinase [Erysipelotrichaceae bacterium]
MRFDSSLYRIWKKRQNDKALKRRTARKDKKRRLRRAIQENNKALKKNPNYDVELKQYRFEAPPNFSIISNPTETLKVFDSLLHYINNNNSSHNEIFVDVDLVNHLSIDSIMYLLCILNNLNKAKKYHFSGNYPRDAKTKKMFFDSGFNKYVDSKVPEDINRQTENIQITSGKNIDTSLAKMITDFIRKKSKTGNSYHYIYEMMIELMGNTWKHAYEGDISDLFDTCWYCYVETDNEKAKITFMDTGIGIPKSIHKRMSEKIDVFGFHKDSEYIASALRGEGRTETQLSNRGKGLPFFVEIVNDSYIEKIRIVSLKGDVCVEKNNIVKTEIDKSFYGTLYYWEVIL